MGYGLGYGFMWDSTYILVLVGAIISALASLNVNGTFSRYKGFRNARGATAEDVARTILMSAGITDVRIERIRGNLTDHYSPREKVLRLSDSVYGSTSIAAIGVAAHECGHAIQHQHHYAFLGLRSMAVPLANFGSMLSWPLLIIGIIMGYFQLAMFGVILFSFVVLFQLITLPVEFNASRRAVKILEERNILIDDELRGAKKVLKAAALTYVAALFTAILQLLRMIMLSRGRRR